MPIGATRASRRCSYRSPPSFSPTCKTYISGGPPSFNRFLCGRYRAASCGCGQLLGDGPASERLHPTIAVENPFSLGRQCGTPAGPAASTCLDQGRLEAGVHGFHEQPGALVAHAQAAAGGGDRPGLPDAFQDVRLARPDRDVRLQHDAQARPDGAISDSHRAMSTRSRRRRQALRCDGSEPAPRPRPGPRPPQAASGTAAPLIRSRSRRHRRAPGRRRGPCPRGSCRASGSCRYFCTARLSGRAP